MNTDKNKIPYSLTKERFLRMVYPLPRHTALERINEIIFDRRKALKKYSSLSRFQIILTKTVEREEYDEYFKTYGYPEGLD